MYIIHTSIRYLKRLLVLIFFLQIVIIKINAQESFFVDFLVHYLKLSDTVKMQLYNVVSPSHHKAFSIIKSVKPLPLFMHYPLLSEHISHVSLGNFPTPIFQMTLLGNDLGIQLFCKNDGLSGNIEQNGNICFGGNKIRKLEFLLADAIAHGAKTIMTFGCAGSNHVVATASCAKQLGLKTIGMLKIQPNAHVVRRNLLLMHEYGAALYHCQTLSERNAKTVEAFLHNKMIYGDFPYVIPTGGSCPLGILGFVNAAFELKQQIEQGIMSEPDYLYVAGGSLGTTVGLLLGLKAAGLDTRLVIVMVEPTKEAYLHERIQNLFQATNDLLFKADATFGLYNLNEHDYDLITEFGGKEYGLFTPEAMNAMHYVNEREKIVLDGTYTSRPMAAIIDHAKKGKLAGKIVLFWNTFCNYENDALKTSDYRCLPPTIHRYFERDVQELDKKL